MRYLGLIFALVCLTLTHAQSWTVQTIALQNYREAVARQEQLYDLGFDAYVDFGMTNGKQFARVRVGCFTGRVAAQTFADMLRGRVTAEAVPVPLEPGAKTTYCVERSVGFATPQNWAIHKEVPGAVSFWVDVQGKRGYLTLGAGGWHLAQDEAELARFLTPNNSAANYPTIFREETTFNIPVTLMQWGAKDFIISSGSLLWQSAYSAVVLEGNAVVAYHIRGNAR